MTPEEVRELRIGDRVVFTHRLRRVSEHRALTPEEGKGLATSYLRAQAVGSRLWLKWWRPFAVDPVAGIVVGRRTYKNGINFSGYDEPIEFVQAEKFTVVLVAYRMDDNPAAVLAEHLAREIAV